MNPWHSLAYLGGFFFFALDVLTTFFRFFLVLPLFLVFLPAFFLLEFLSILDTGFLMFFFGFEFFLFRFLVFLDDFFELEFASRLFLDLLFFFFLALRYS